MSQGNYDWEGEAIALRAQLKNTDKAYESNRRLAEELVQEKMAMKERIAELEEELSNVQSMSQDHEAEWMEKINSQAQCIKEMREALAEAELYISTVLSAYDESFQRHPSKERERAIIVSDLENIRAVLARWPE